MNLLSNLSPTYRQSLADGGSPEIHEAPRPGDRRGSPYTDMMDTLQRLRQIDLPLYQRVKEEAAGCLQLAIRSADAGLDIRQLVTRRRGALLRSMARGLNRLYPRD